MSKKVLILSASTGGGHNRAARAIKEEITKKIINGENLECEIVDSLKFVHNMMDKIISQGYEKSALYTPKAYGRAYRISESDIISKHEFKNNPIAGLMARKLGKLIESKKPDVIIGTHPFPMIALCSIKKDNSPLENKLASTIKKNLKLSYEIDMPPMISVLTDYTTHSTWIQQEIDHYIVGDEFVKQLLIEELVAEKKVHTYGIPVEKSFLTNRDRQTVLSELNLDKDKFTILLMGGSFGAGNIRETLIELLDINRDFQIIVISGRNETLKEKIDKSLLSYTHNKNVCSLGFTDKMNDILASVDILITKPGGLTTTEALLKGIPMIIPYYIPGQEEENLDFLLNCGAALKPTKKYTIPVLIKTLIDDPNRLKRLKENIDCMKKYGSAEKIADLVLQELYK
jgi:processive 1,2-diacylglycerol beta-glucosyltransferase